MLASPTVVGGAVTVVFSRSREKLGDLLFRISSKNFPVGEEVGVKSGQGPSVTDEKAENLIAEKAPELVSTVFERLQAEHAMELAQGQPQAHELIQRLLRQLAVTEIRAAFESIYAHIYGSQVAALRALGATSDGATRESVEAHLTEVKSDGTMRHVAWLQTLAFEAWFGYLQRNGLAEVGAGELYRITTKGTGFLGFIEGSVTSRRASNVVDSRAATPDPLFGCSTMTPCS
jgi:hypothetical protein